MHPLLEPILKETFGVVLYQEQVMQIVQVLAGFTLGQADLLRRAMGKKKQEILISQKENFLKGCREHDVDEKKAATIFELLLKFADYGFNKSHSAAYAFVAWQTAYLKAHYPAPFMAAMLSSIMDTDKVPHYIELAHRMNIKILPPDINVSNSDFSVDNGNIRFGLAAVKSIGENLVRGIVEAREKGGIFKSLTDFCLRAETHGINKTALANLIKCGAFDSFGHTRQSLLVITETVLAAATTKFNEALSGQIGLFQGEEDNNDEITPPKLEEAPLKEVLGWEKEITGFYITGHPLDQYREIIEKLHSIKSCFADNLKDRALVRVAGLLNSVRQRVTKKGDMMCFAEIEDYTASIDIIVFPKTYYEYMDLLFADAAVVIDGKIDLSGDAPKILAEKITRLDDYRQEYYIVMSEDTDDEEIRSKLREIFAAHMGDRVVHLKINNRWKKAGKDFWLDGTPESVAEISALLGENAVVMR